MHCWLRLPASCSQLLLPGKSVRAQSHPTLPSGWRGCSQPSSIVFWQSGGSFSGSLGPGILRAGLPRPSQAVSAPPSSLIEPPGSSGPCLIPAPSPDAPRGCVCRGRGGIGPCQVYTWTDTRVRGLAPGRTSTDTLVTPSHTGCVYACSLLSPDSLSSPLPPPSWACEALGGPGSLLPCGRDGAGAGARGEPSCREPFHLMRLGSGPLWVGKEAGRTSFQEKAVSCPL